MKTRVVRGGARGWVAAVALGVVAASLASPRAGVGSAADEDAELLKEAQGLFKPIAAAKPDASGGLVELGRKLFFDPRISADGTVSCSRCHLATLYSTDGLAKSRGANNKPLARNAPTLFNTADQFAQHWDGVFDSVEAQAKKALTGAGFGNPSFDAAMTKLKGIAGYPPLFARTFPGEADPVTPDNWAKAIGAFERTLVTPSRFDEYLGGKADALSADERKGLRTFIDTGCAECHEGAGLGGTGYRKFGVSSDYWLQTHSQEVDKGRFNLTKNPSDMYRFKVPQLRNAAMTPPYFHDGSVAALPEAVRVMAKVQLDTELSADEAKSIATFLGSLTGEVPEHYAKAPVLPPGSFDPGPAPK
ncbi:cytochrome-c peroxidase [Singulisphaera sp. PoT]|uniref:cytochrome-c peroxidase n=1 Tax=Singulisphaera sp. PoT TaxID=3411797 RepID=UPI003BF53FE4